MRSHNPVLTRNDTWQTEVQNLEQMYAAPQRMTIDDVVVKTGIMLGILGVTAAATWLLDLWVLALPAMLVGLVLALVITFKKTASPALCIAYAAVEGVFVGAVSMFFERRYPGIVLQAVGGTILCFGGVLAAYKTGKLRATPRFKKVIISSMMGIFALYMVNLAIGLFGGDGLGFINDSGAAGIAFSLFVVTIASLSFVLDFEIIEEAERHGVPENVSWKVAFGLVAGLIWLYIELLRLLAKLRD